MGKSEMVSEYEGEDENENEDENDEERDEPDLIVPWKKVKTKKGYVNSDGTECDICHKSFGRRADLTRHIRTVHEKQRDYECNLCEKGFVKNTDLNRHIRNIHKKPKVRKEY